MTACTASANVMKLYRQMQHFAVLLWRSCLQMPWSYAAMQASNACHPLLYRRIAAVHTDSIHVYWQRQIAARTAKQPTFEQAHVNMLLYVSTCDLQCNRGQHNQNLQNHTTFCLSAFYVEQQHFGDAPAHQLLKHSPAATTAQQ